MTNQVDQDILPAENDPTTIPALNEGNQIDGQAVAQDILSSRVVPDDVVFANRAIGQLPVPDGKRDIILNLANGVKRNFDQVAASGTRLAVCLYQIQFETGVDDKKMAEVFCPLLGIKTENWMKRLLQAGQFLFLRREFEDMGDVEKAVALARVPNIASPSVLDPTGRLKLSGGREINIHEASRNELIAFLRAGKAKKRKTSENVEQSGSGSKDNPPGEPDLMAKVSEWLRTGREIRDSLRESDGAFVLEKSAEMDAAMSEFMSILESVQSRERPVENTHA